MMLYKSTKAMVCSSHDDTYFFDFIAGILQGDTFYSTSIHYLPR